jgi:hypothetical protein
MPVPTTKCLSLGSTPGPRPRFDGVEAFTVGYRSGTWKSDRRRRAASGSAIARGTAFCGTRALHLTPGRRRMTSALTPEQQLDPSLNVMDQRQDDRRRQREKLRISKFDIVTSLFTALILFIGAFVLMLFIVWLLGGKPAVRPLKPIIENPAGRGDNAEGFERDFEPPGAEEVEDLMEPTLQDTIEAVTDAVSTVAATLDSMNTNATATTAGSGKGDSRPPGPEGEGEDIVPRFERWELRFSSKNLSSYAGQLDFYGIELGALGGQIQGVDVVDQLAMRPRSRRLTGKSEREPYQNRLYFMWRSPSPLMEYDRQLLQQAGVQLRGRQMLKFVPPELENLLANLELEYAKSKGYTSVIDIAKTVFESKPSGNGYAFEVIEQRYRRGRRST